MKDIITLHVPARLNSGYKKRIAVERDSIYKVLELDDGCCIFIKKGESIDWYNDQLQVSDPFEHVMELITGVKTLTLDKK